MQTHIDVRQEEVAVARSAAEQGLARHRADLAALRDHDARMRDVQFIRPVGLVFAGNSYRQVTHVMDFERWQSHKVRRFACGRVSRASYHPVSSPRSTLCPDCRQFEAEVYASEAHQVIFGRRPQRRAGVTA